MRKDSPLAQKESVSPEDLWDKPLILSYQTSSSGEMNSWFKKDISQLNMVSYCDLLYNASQLVKAGFGYAVSLGKLINTSGESELCFRPLSPPLEAGLCLAWKRYQIFSKVAEKFLKGLQKHFGTVAE